MEQSITAYEVGYTGVIKQRATVSAAFFFNETKDDIFFTQVASYRADNPPPRLAAVRRFRRSWADHPRGPLLPAGLHAARAAPVPVRRGQRPAGGVQLPQPRQGASRRASSSASTAPFTKEWSGFANYSYQPDPKAIGFPQSEINLPPNNRFNVGVNYGGIALPGQPGRQLPGRGVLAGRARQPLRGHDRRLHAGQRHVRRKWGSKRNIVTLLKATNLLNDEIQQHIFGDVSSCRLWVSCGSASNERL